MQGLSLDQFSKDKLKATGNSPSSIFVFGCSTGIGSASVVIDLVYPHMPHLQLIAIAMVLQRYGTVFGDCMHQSSTSKAHVTGCVSAAWAQPLSENGLCSIHTICKSNISSARFSHPEVKEFMFCLIDTSGVILTIDLLLSGDELVEEKQLALKCLEEQS